MQYTWLKTVFDSRTHQKTKEQKTSGGNDEKMVVRHTQTLFSSLWMPLKMSSQVGYSFSIAMRKMTAMPWSFCALHLSCPNQLTANRPAHAFSLSYSSGLVIANQYTHALSSELHKFIKSLHNSQDNHRTAWISGDKTTVQPGPNHSYAAWNWDLSLRFNKSSQESKIWIRSHKYLSIHKQEKHVPQFDSQRLTKVTQDGLNGNSKRAVVPCKRASDMDCRTVRLFQMPNGVHSDRRVRSSPKQLHQSTTP